MKCRFFNWQRNILLGMLDSLKRIKIINSTFQLSCSPAGKMTLFQRRTNVGNYLYDVESTLKNGWKCKLDWCNFSDVETTLILRCECHQPKLNVKPTLKYDVRMLMLNQRSQNDVRITLISRCWRFNLFSTKFQRRNDVVCPLGHYLIIT